MEQADAAIARYRGGERRDLDQRQLTQLVNAAWAAGLSLLMAGRRHDASKWLRTAAARYRESWDAGAPADSWGRPIAAMKALLLAGDDASGPAHWALEAGAEDVASPIGRYAGALALLVLGRDADAGRVASTLRDDESFPQDVADGLVALAAHEEGGYRVAASAILSSFESRDGFLEDVRVADTVLVLELLAAPRGLAAELPRNALLP